VERARKGGGPSLIECKTYRWRGHYEGEADRTYHYRTKKEIESWMRKCPIERFKKILLERHIMKEAELKRIDQDVQKELEEAIQFAEESPFPNPEDALKDLYAES